MVKIQIVINLLNDEGKKIETLYKVTSDNIISHIKNFIMSIWHTITKKKKIKK